MAYTDRPGGFLDNLRREVASEVSGVWQRIDQIVMANQEKVLDAFIAERVALYHMSPSTGYGYGDAGRETLDRLYARALGAEAGLVRTHWASGTHALSTGLFGLTLPGDDVLCVTGPTYDTLLPVLGPKGLLGRGVTFRESDLLLQAENGTVSPEGLLSMLRRETRDNTALYYVQRSRGYRARKSVRMSTLSDFVQIARSRFPDVRIMVDNCYCEFVEEREPPSVGVSLTVGSLIKNPGGGLAPTGAYAVGKEDAVAMVAERLYAPGLGDMVGCNPAGYKDLYQGLFMAPKVVGEALKGAVWAAALLSRMGYNVDPSVSEPRADVVQAIDLRSPQALLTFIGAIQAASPVDSYVTPEPGDMPGYDHKVIMAAGTFVQGASIELSCDGPYIEPYTAYFQGGLTKEHAVIALERAARALLNLGADSESPS